MTPAALLAIIVIWAVSDVVVAGLGCLARWVWYPEPRPTLAERIKPHVLSELDVRVGVVA